MRLDFFYSSNLNMDICSSTSLINSVYGQYKWQPLKLCPRRLPPQRLLVYMVRVKWIIIRDVTAYVYLFVYYSKFAEDATACPFYFCTQWQSLLLSPWLVVQYVLVSYSISSCFWWQNECFLYQITKFKCFPTSQKFPSLILL